MEDFAVGVLPNDNPIAAIMQSGYNLGYDTGYRAGQKAARPKWISVEERLPEDGQRVVGIAKNGMTGIMDYRDDGTPFAARIFGVYFSNITHWMPLPEPPKE